MRSTGRRSLLLGFMVGATVLATASAAFACTVYRGVITVTAGPAGSGVASAEGKEGVHEYCSGQQRQNIAIVGTFTLAIAPPSGACPGGALAAGNYQVLYLPISTTLPGSPLPLNNCNFDGVSLGPITVANGAGSGTYALPSTAGPSTVGHVNICVTKATDVPLQQNNGDPSAPELHLNLISI